MERDPLICIVGSNRYSIDRFVASNKLKRQDYIIISSVQSMRGLGEVIYVFLEGWEKSSVYPVFQIMTEISRINRGGVIRLPDSIIVGESYFELIMNYVPVPLFKRFMNLMLKRYFQEP